MKKRLLGILLSGVLAAAVLTPMTAMADGEKVVTLGADLDENQKNAVLKYFGILGQNVRTLTITNQDERNHLASYVPIEQIGTRTFSCALVNPTTSGGIQVKTANLTWVTGNMIASTLSTSGVVNCEVLAAAPFEVSGTGALTGVIMAYESASGTTLDPVKKDIATQELVATTTIASSVGQTEATNIINEIKIQIIEGEVVDPYEVEEIVEEVIEADSVVQLSDADRALLNDLANRIATQQYNYDEMRETLERVEQNVNVNVNVEQPAVNVTVSNDANNSSSNTNTNNTENTSTNTSNNTNNSESSNTNTSNAEAAGGESILNSTDETALGTDVVVTDTQEAAPEVQEALGITEGQEAVTPQEPAASDEPFAITTSDSYTDVPAADTGDVSVAAADPNLDNPEAGQIADQTTYVETPDVTTVEQPVYVETPEVTVDQPEAQVDQPEVYVEQPEVTMVDQPQEPAPEPEPTPEPEPQTEAAPEVAAPAEVVLDEDSVKVFPESNSNVTGANVLRLRVSGAGYEPVANDDGSFGTVTISGYDVNTTITLANMFDPSAYDKEIVAVSATAPDAAAGLGWTDGTDIAICLGDVFSGFDASMPGYTIDIQNLTLAQKAEDGSVAAKGVLNRTIQVYKDQIGLTFDAWSINDFEEYNTLTGYVVMPENSEEEGVIYTAYIESSGIGFAMNEDGRSFTADLNACGDAQVTVNVSADGGASYTPYTFVVPVLPTA